MSAHHQSLIIAGEVILSPNQFQRVCLSKPLYKTYCFYRMQENVYLLVNIGLAFHSSILSDCFSF